VVLVLVGIIVSMMTLTVGDGGKYRALEEEANRLKTLIHMAREEVILHSQEWRIAFREDGYQFERVKDIQGLATAAKVDDDKQPDKQPDEEKGTTAKNWVQIDNKIFRFRALAGYRLKLLIEDEEYTASREEGEKVEENIIGVVNIYYSGEMIPFELTIEQEDGDDRFILKASPFGELVLTSSRDEAL